MREERREMGNGGGGCDTRIPAPGWLYPTATTHRPPVRNHLRHRQSRPCPKRPFERERFHRVPLARSPLPPPGKCRRHEPAGFRLLARSPYGEVVGVLVLGVSVVPSHPSPLNRVRRCGVEGLVPQL